MIRPAALAAALLALAGCGLQPMYAGGGSGTVARGLAAVDVPPIEGRAGWLVRNALRDRLGAAGAESPRYRLDVRLDEAVARVTELGTRAGGVAELDEVAASIDIVVRELEALRLGLDDVEGAA